MSQARHNNLRTDSARVTMYRHELPDEWKKCSRMQEEMDVKEFGNFVQWNMDIMPEDRPAVLELRDPGRPESPNTDPVSTMYDVLDSLWSLTARPNDAFRGNTHGSTIHARKCPLPSAR